MTARTALRIGIAALLLRSTLRDAAGRFQDPHAWSRPTP